MVVVDKVVEKLRSQIAQNQYHPFQEQINGTLKLSTKSNAFLPAVALLIASTISSVYLIISQTFNHPLFLFPHIGLLVSSIAILALRNKNVQTLFPSFKEYAVTRGSSLVRGKYHNVYIRLVKTIQKGKKGHQMYYLVFSGYLVDEYRLSSPSPSANQLRKLGQEIARNLGLNYFDKTNTSRHHVCLHVRPEKQGFMFDNNVKKDRESVRKSLDGLYQSRNVLATAEVFSDSVIDMDRPSEVRLDDDEGANDILAQLKNEDEEGVLIFS